MNFGSQHENIPMCRMGACTNVPAKRGCVIWRIMNIMLASFLCTGAHGHSVNHRRGKNKEEKILGESTLEVCSFKKGFEEHRDILTCIWQDQVWLQFIAALSSALGKTEPTASRWRGAKEEQIRAVPLLTLPQLFSAPSLFDLSALLDSKN